MWTEEHRRLYRRGEGYPSDLRDAVWARLAPPIPRASSGGRPRKTDMRAAMNAILYLLRTGCPRRYMPRDSFPPRSTVPDIFRKFQRDGVCEAIWAELHMALRERIGQEAAPWRRFLTANRSNRQKRRRQDNQVDHDAGKQVKDCKIHEPVDSEGCRRFQDRAAAGLVLDKIRRRSPCLESIQADGDSNAWQVHAALAKCRGCAWRSSRGSTT
jgi:transposase